MPIIKYDTDDQVLNQAALPALTRQFLTPQTAEERDAALSKDAIDAAPPSFLAAAAAGFRRQNTIVSPLASETGGLNPYKKDEGFDVFALDKGTEWDDPSYDEERSEIFNARYYEAWKAQKKRERQDRNTLDAAGWKGIAAEVLGSVIDPTIAIGGPTAKGATSALKAAKSFAIGGTLGAVASEAVLQGSQLDRTASETAINIGAGALFSAVIGGGIGAVMSRAERRAVQKSLVDMQTQARLITGDSVADAEAATAARIRENAGSVDGLGPGDIRAQADEIVAGIQSTAGDQSVGAASARRLTPEGDDVDRRVIADADDLSIAGVKGTTQMAEGWGWNPILRLSKSLSTRARQIGAELLENGAYTKLNYQGDSLGNAVETLVARHQGAEAVRNAEHANIWKANRKDATNGERLTRTEFNERVAKAMRRGDADEGGNRYVEQAAKNYRTHFDNLKKEAVELGLLDPKVVDKVTPDRSYLPRLWSSSKIRSNEAGFRDMMSEYFRQQVEKEVVRATGVKDARVAKLRQQIDELSMTGEDRALRIQELEGEARSIRETHADTWGVVDDQIAGLRRRGAEAGAKGDTATVQSIEDGVADLRTAAGADYAAYRADLRRLEAPLRRLRRGVEGSGDSVNAAWAKIAAIADANMSRMQRLHKAMSKIEKEMGRWDPARLEDEVRRLQGMFDDILERSRKASDDFNTRQSTDMAEARRTSRVERPDSDRLSVDQAEDIRDRIREAIDGPPGSRLEGETIDGPAFPEELKAIGRELGWDGKGVPTEKQLQRLINKRLQKQDELPAWLKNRVAGITAKKPNDPSRKFRSRPVLAWIREQGGIDPDGSFAQAMRAIGIDGRNSPGAFSRNGRKSMDNLVRDETELFRNLPDDGNGYVREQDIVDALSDEMRGNPLRTEDELAKLDDYDQTLGWFEGMEDEFRTITGVDPNGMTADEIFAALRAEGIDWDRIGELYEAGRTVDDPDVAPAPTVVTRKARDEAAQANIRENQALDDELGRLAGTIESAKQNLAVFPDKAVFKEELAAAQARRKEIAAERKAINKRFKADEAAWEKTNAARHDAMPRDDRLANYFAVGAQKDVGPVERVEILQSQICEDGSAVAVVRDLRSDRAGGGGERTIELPAPTDDALRAWERNHPIEDAPEADAAVDLAARLEDDPIAKADAKRTADAEKRMAVRQALFEAAEAKRVERAARLNERIRTAEALDPQARMMELRKVLDDRMRQTGAVMQRESIRIGDLVRKMKTSSPEAAKARIADIEGRIGRIEADYRARTIEGLDADRGYEGYVTAAVDQIYAKLGGVMEADVPEGIVSDIRGPLKDRTLHIDDLFEANGTKVEDFIEMDLEHIAERHTRQMGADIELKRKFGSPSMQERIGEIVSEYQAMRKAVDLDQTLTDAQKASRIKTIQAEEKTILRDVAAMRDILRGNHLAKENNSVTGRAIKVGMAASYVSDMGGVALASVTDIAAPMMRHGFVRYFGDGLVPLIRNGALIKMRQLEAQNAGTLVDLIRNTRLSTLADINNPNAYGTAFERFVGNAANLFSRATLLNHWNYLGKSIAASITQARIADNIAKGFDRLPQAEQRYMAYLGLNEEMQGRIAQMVDEFGEKVQGATVTNSHLWSDVQARNEFLGAVKKDIDVTIITKSVGDVPLFMHHPVGRMVTQFQSFAMASNQRLLLRGLGEAGSEGQAMRQAGGAAAMVMLGMMIYMIKQKEAGREITANPGALVMEGIDRSGLVSFPMMFNNMAERLGAPGAYTLAGLAGQAATGAEGRPRSSRYQIRNFGATLLGPTFGTVQDTISVTGDLLGEFNQRVGLANKDTKGVDKETIAAFRRIAPFVSLMGIRSFVDGVLLPAANEAVE